MTSADKRLDVQGLRALAVLFVVAFHGDFGIGGGFVGVDVFFAISGFVITSTLLRELTHREALDLVAFYIRRLKRILPALAAMVTIVVVLGIALTPVGATRTSVLTALAASVFGANVYLEFVPHGYFAVDSTLNPLLHTWSLGVEEQFYLVYPVVLLLGWRLGSRARHARAVATAVILVLTLASFQLASSWNHSHATRTFYSAPTRAWEFGLGALTALLMPVWSRLPNLAAAVLAAISLPLLLASGIGAAAESSLMARVGIPVFATCALMAAGARRNVVSYVLGWRPLTSIGDCSYSLYLWHWPLIVFAKAVVPNSAWSPRGAAILAVAPAVASFRLIENPLRRKPALRPRAALALAGSCVGLPFVAAAATLPLSLVTPSTYAPALHQDFNSGCDTNAPLGAPSRAKCIFTVRRSRGTIVLIGDSNAGQFTEPVIAASRRLRYDLSVVTLSACPFVPLRFWMRSEFVACERRNVESLNVARRMRPNLMIIAGRTDTWLNDPSLAVGYGNVPIARASPLKERLYERALHRELMVLTRAGVPVVVINPVPQLGVDQPGCAPILFLVGGCGGDTSRAAVDAELSRAVTAERDAVRGVAGASLLSFERNVCDGSRCSSRQHVPMYRNIDHLSVVGALTLTPRLVETIRARARVDYAPCRASACR
jgi:peptidoglycan/LPS O-acetylase OafA/YrhL